MFLTSRNILLSCFLIYFIEIAYSSLSLNQEKSKFIYEKYVDENKNGKLDINDVHALVNRFRKFKNWPINGERYTTALNHLTEVFGGMLEHSGAKDTGYMTVEQWIKLWENYATNPDQHHWEPKFEGIMFNAFDVDDDAAISANDFATFYKSFGKDTNELKVMFGKMSQGKPSINKEEFAKILKDLFTGSDPHSPSNYLSGSSQFNE